MKHWEKLSQPPRTALKTIGGGRLKGMTDVNPQWRYKAMTEAYGACGEGWKYSIDRLWIEDGTNGEKVAFAQISLKVGGEAIPGIGGSMFIANEKSGLRTNDEAFKMAVTDALSVAMKMLGVASAIYEGRWDGTKYRDEPMGQVTPTAGAEEALDSIQKNKVDAIASSIIDCFEAWDIDKATVSVFSMIEQAKLDSEEKIYLWTFLDSKQRASLKKYADAKRKSEMVALEGSQA